MQNKNLKSSIVVIAGPTSSGKSALALDIANKLNGAIINADSMQVYKDIPIISAQPSNQDKQKVEHLLYGYLESDEKSNVMQWAKLCKKAVTDTINKGKLPIVVGGTGFYIKTLLHGISEVIKIPEDFKKQIIDKVIEKGNDYWYHKLSKVDKNILKSFPVSDTQRLTRALEVYEYSGKTLTQWQKENPAKKLFRDINFICYKILPVREQLYHSCNSRFDIMLNNGALAEVSQLKIKEVASNSSVLNALGVKELLSFLDGKYDLNFAIEKSKQSTRNFAKRQMTWFRNSFDEGKVIKQLYTQDLSGNIIYELKKL